MRAVLLAVLVAAAMTTACASERVRVFKPTGSVQCGDAGARGAAGLEALAKPLEGAGVRVLGRACGSDGRMHAMVCGAPDGRIAIFDVPAGDAEAARRLGYAALPAEAREQPCP